MRSAELALILVPILLAGAWLFGVRGLSPRGTVAALALLAGLIAAMAYLSSVNSFTGHYEPAHLTAGHVEPPNPK